MRRSYIGSPTRINQDISGSWHRLSSLCNAGKHSLERLCYDGLCDLGNLYFKLKINAFTSANSCGFRMRFIGGMGLIGVAV